MTVGTAQASHTDFALHTLGWKAFQDLCAEVAREILKRSVELYHPSKDGGRDACFIGRFNEASSINAAELSTIQCKFTASADAKLRLSNLKPEEESIEALVKAGLATGYVLMTNMSVSGTSAAAISARLRSLGVKFPEILGREAITSLLISSPRLRALVPRVYGLGDLSWIADVRRIQQAKAVLDRLGEEGLRTYVPTEAHRRAVNALHRFNIALLVGEPASGKSTIAAILAANALDMDSRDIVRIDRPEEFSRHWNPNEESRFFWIDDAFGSNQLRRDFVDEWTRKLPEIRSVLRSGNRIVFTSRDYIWNEAKPHLRFSSLAGLDKHEGSLITIELSDLSVSEREQILYNHIKLGDQPTRWRRRVSQFLPSLARHPRFLPEIARRLGRSTFTTGLAVSAETLRDFVASPKRYLAETIDQLPPPSQAALALIYVNGGRLPSPIPKDDRLEIVQRFLGIRESDIRDHLDNLKESFVLLIEDDDGFAWVYKHPTILDAYSDILSETPEGLDLYIRGARPSDIMASVVCGIELPGEPMRVPLRLYDVLAARLATTPDDTQENYSLFNFLARRCDDFFLERIALTDSNIVSRDCYNFVDIMSDNRIRVLGRLVRLGRLDRRNCVSVARELQRRMERDGDVRFLDSNDHLALFSRSELVNLGIEVSSVPSRMEQLIDEAETSYDDPGGALAQLERSLDVLEKLMPAESDAVDIMQEARERIDDARITARRREFEDDYTPDEDEVEPPSPSSDAEERSIFDDLHL